MTVAMTMGTVLVARLSVRIASLPDVTEETEGENCGERGEPDKC